MVKLSENFLLVIGGVAVFRAARVLQQSGAVSEAHYEPPIVRGRIAQGGRSFLSGLKILSMSDAENLCPCRESRQQGRICPHALAVALAILRPEVHPSQKTSALQRPAPPDPGVGERAQETSEIPRVIVRLEGSLRNVEATLRFEYSQSGIQNRGFEDGIRRELQAAGFEDVSDGRKILRGEDAILRFLGGRLPDWQARWQVETGSRWQEVTKSLEPIEPHFALRTREDGWLDFHVHFSAGQEAVFSQQELSALLGGGRNHTRLKSGRMALMNADMLADLEEVLRDCSPSQSGGSYRIHPVHRSYLESSMRDWKHAPHSPATSPPPPTGTLRLKSLRAQLRPYQAEGAGWMLALAAQGFGGILADEMGLGKTVQALALIEALEGPCLVVCPSSLVWNWCLEARRFLPGLPVLALEGEPQARAAPFVQIPQSRLVVTSYATLRNDLARHRPISYSAVILDEAQHIKNPDSQNARAACGLKAAARFVLTGTPVENSLRDLWSLFEFLQPGLLGSRKDFKERYEVPLDSPQGVEDVRTRLSRRTAAFILRRKKSDVLPELPEKTEQVLEVELNPEQKSAYTALQIAARTEMDSLKSQVGNAGAARLRALTALLRLRQACCDLELLGKTAKAPSAKRTALREILQEATDGGHRALIFSQFIGTLDLISGDLDDMRIRHTRLDGSTRDRANVISAFQNDPALAVFLISLKAGGVGLNLTGADMVIHYDPWWNPAVESQATDRAHRIGQKRALRVIKLVARDTVEEKVLRMQESKRALLETTLDPSTVSAALTLGDISELLESEAGSDLQNSSESV